MSQYKKLFLTNINTGFRIENCYQIKNDNDSHFAVCAAYGTITDSNGVTGERTGIISVENGQGSNVETGEHYEQ